MESNGRPTLQALPPQTVAAASQPRHHTPCSQPRIRRLTRASWEMCQKFVEEFTDNFPPVFDEKEKTLNRVSEVYPSPRATL